MKEKTQRLQLEKENAEAKFDAKRKQVKELEQKLQREQGRWEQERVEVRMKQSNLQE